MATESPAGLAKRRRLDRVTAACDLCKKRKVKCDGEQPCAYCKLKDRAATCAFTVSKAVDQIRPPGPIAHQPGRSRSDTTPTRSRSHHSVPRSGPLVSPTESRAERHHDTVVPLEGRILRDAQGKFIFIGDCAPLSFLQTVRHLIASEVDPEGFPLQAVRDSIIEVPPLELASRHRSLSVTPEKAQALVGEYAVATSGLVELFQHDDLLREIRSWADITSHSNSAAAAVFYLVLAVGAQEHEEEQAEAWFSHARNLLLQHMTSNMNVSMVQGFTLVAIFMLRAFQPNGAYLYFSLAARTAYAIGIHRTEVNASFGESIRAIRDRIWISLRVVDMLISTILGRPPSTSDVDCTVKYKINEVGNESTRNKLDASVQIFTIIERIVVEVYSRKRISLRIADYVSRQLKLWASNWLQPLSDVATKSSRSRAPRESIVGACSVLCSYYYAILLLTRPFLIYDLYEHMGASMKDRGTESDHQDKQKYADAALDAAITFVDTLKAVIHSDNLPHRMPLVVSWLFNTSLVLAVGILGRSGLSFEEHCEASIQCLTYFGKVDPTARQYSLITRSLLEITTSYIKKKQVRLRMQRKQASSQLFGLLHSDPDTRPAGRGNCPPQPAPESSIPPSLGRGEIPPVNPVDWTIYDSDFFALPWASDNDQGLQDFLQPGTHNLDGASVADIPLFPIYDRQVNDNFL